VADVRREAQKVNTALSALLNTRKVDVSGMTSNIKKDMAFSTDFFMLLEMKLLYKEVTSNEPRA
jgi:hypothetical protein